jgi:hypothetical protein
MGHTALMEETTNAYNMLVSTPQRKRPYVRRMSKWKDNIKTDLRRK